MKKKILFYISGIYNGGTEIALLNLLDNLDKNKYEIFINYTDYENLFHPIADKILKHAKYININEKNVVDTLIYCNHPGNNINTIINNIKYTRAYFWFHYFGDGQEEFLELAIKNNYIDKIITVCQTIKNILEKQLIELKSNRDKVIVIHNILDVQSILNKSNENIDIGLSSGLNFVTVARFSIIKGYHRVKKLVNELENKNVKFKYLIIGNGNTKEDEERTRDMFRNDKNVIFLGYQENPYKYVKHCDYNVLLSDRENMSLSLMEAKILGVPNIVTDFDSAFEQVTDMENGIILSRKDLDTYKDRINDIINEDNLNKFKKNNKNFMYNISKIKSQWNEIL